MSLANSILQFLGRNGGRNRQEFALDDLNDLNDDLRPVSWTPGTVHRGDPVVINYRGILKNDGADEVYLHYGFDRWQMPVRTVKMARQENGTFAAEIAAEAKREINFCFKDSADHWDNNNGRDWSLPLSAKR
ncbi:MAG: carbohydrate-binding protein [Bacteroidota bacterium]